MTDDGSDAALARTRQCLATIVSAGMVTRVRHGVFGVSIVGSGAEHTMGPRVTVPPGRPAPEAT
jgi:hypothetical protein